MDIGALSVRIEANLQGLQEGVNRAEGFLSGVKKAALGLGAVLAGGAIFKSFIDDAAEAEANLSQLDTVLKSTGGAAGVSRDEITELASSLQKVTKFSDDQVLSGQNLLLTFTKIGKDVFPQATETMLNMSQALGQDVKGSAIQLGKALNDPINGVTALKRVGVSFTESQMAQIKAMQESGNVMGAQKLILQELNTEFGNSARAAGETFGGKIERLKNQLGEVKETIGGALLPALSGFANWFIEKSPEIEDFITNSIDKLGNAFQFVKDKADILVPAIAGVTGAIAAQAIIGGITNLYRAWRAATVTMTTAQWLLNAAMAANPIGLVAAAIGILIAAGVALYKNWDVVKAKAQELWAKITEFWASIKNLSWDDIKVKIANALTAAWEYIGQWFDDLKTKTTEKLSAWWESIRTWFSEMPGKISEQLSTWWTSIGLWFDGVPEKMKEKLIAWKDAMVQWTNEQNEENKRQFGEWWNAISAWFTSIPGKIKEKLTEWKTAITAWYEATKSAIKEKLSGWWESISAWFKEVPGKIRTSLSGWWTAMSTWFKEIPGKMKTELESWWKTLKDWFSSIGGKAVTEVSTGAQENKKELLDNLGKILIDVAEAMIVMAGVALVAAGREIIKRIGSGVKELAGEAVQWGKDVVQGLWNGIVSMGTTFKANLAAWIDEHIPEVVQKILGISSPSKVMEEFGQMVSEGLAQGIKKRASRVKEEAEKLVGIIKDVSNSMIDKLGATMDIVSKEFKIMELRLNATTSSSEKLEEAKKVLAQELGLTEKETNDLTNAYGNDTEKLYELGIESKKVALQKQELAKQLGFAQEKADVLTEAYDRMVKAQGANSLAALELKNQLLDVQVAAAEYSNEIVEANKKISDSAKAVYEEYGQMSEKVGKSTGKSATSTEGWKYLDKYGKEHVTDDKSTAEKYGQAGTVEKYSGKYAGGYAFADGGVINKPTAALLGETFRARPEIVSPISLLESTFKNVLKSFQPQNGGDIIIQNMHVRNDNDAKLIARELDNLQKSRSRGSGVVYG